MGRVRSAALCGLIAVLVVTVGLWATGAAGPIYRWMTRYMRPDVWSALAAWVAVAVAVATVLVAGRYAKQQVDKATDQVEEARLTREEQAQPNVVLYSEPNPHSWQILEIVVKNFGTTPAYDIKIRITPPLQSTPNFLSYPNIAEVPVPSRIPILAPGQAWKTVWDTATERLSHLRDLNNKLGKAEIRLLDYYGQIPNRRHSAIVTYTDSKRVKRYETTAELNFNMLDGTTQIDVNTIHDLTKTLGKAHDELRKIAKTLELYSADEHKGIWVYVSDADTERAYRTAKNEQLIADMKSYPQRLAAARKRSRERRAAKKLDSQPDNQPEDNNDGN